MDRATTKARFNFNFFAYSQKMDTPESLITFFFSPEKLALLSLLKEVKTQNDKTSFI